MDGFPEPDARSPVTAAQGPLSPELMHRRRVLAGRQLPVGRPALPVRQPAAETAAGAVGREAARGRALGNDTGAELHLRAPEPGHQEIRPGHVLRGRPGSRRPGAGGQHLPRGNLQRDLPRHQPGRGGAAEAVHPVLVPRRDLQPRRAHDTRVDSRGRRARVLAQPHVRGRVRQPRPDRRLRHRRRRGGDRSPGHLPAGRGPAQRRGPELPGLRSRRDAVEFPGRDLRGHQPPVERRHRPPG
jgi:hypothetical protein